MTTLQKRQSALELKGFEDLGYIFVSWDQRNSKLSQDDMSWIWHDTGLNPMPVSDIPHMQGTTMQYRITRITENEYEDDANAQNISIISELVAKHRFIGVFA